MDLGQAIRPEEVMRDQPFKPLTPYDATAIAVTDPNERYDGEMFLNIQDAPVNLDPNLVPVTEKTRYFSSQGLVDQYYPIPLQPNYFYQPTLPIIFK